MFEASILTLWPHAPFIRQKIQLNTEDYSLQRGQPGEDTDNPGFIPISLLPAAHKLEQH